MNVIPALQPEQFSDDSEWSPDSLSDIKAKFKKVKKVRARLVELYNPEFFVTLVQQAVIEKDRFPVRHHRLDIGDVVLLGEKHLKPNRFPTAIVRKLTVNLLNETTGTVIKNTSKRMS